MLWKFEFLKCTDYPSLYFLFWKLECLDCKMEDRFCVCVDNRVENPFVRHLFALKARSLLSTKMHFPPYSGTVCAILTKGKTSSESLIHFKTGFQSLARDSLSSLHCRCIMVSIILSKGDIFICHTYLKRILCLALYLYIPSIQLIIASYIHLLSFDLEKKAIKWVDLCIIHTVSYVGFYSEIAFTAGFFTMKISLWN